MKTKEIKEQLELLRSFMDAYESLYANIDIDYNHEKYLEDGYKTIAERLNVSVEEVRRIDGKN